MFSNTAVRGETRGTVPDALNKATCYRKLAEVVAKRAECAAAIRRHYCEIANSYLAAARAELSCAEQETARRRIVISAPPERATAISAHLFPINHSSGRGVHAAEPNDVFGPRYG
jgi:hypothetical protein